MSTNLLAEIYPTLRWYWQPGNSEQEELLSRVQHAVENDSCALGAEARQELILSVHRLTSSYQWADGGAEQRQVQKMLQENLSGNR